MGVKSVYSLRFKMSQNGAGMCEPSESAAYAMSAASGHREESLSTEASAAPDDREGFPSISVRIEHPALFQSVSWR
jgi:hypothetical protein